MTVRHWPLMGDLEVFYSGGFENDQEDLRKILRQIARWMEHEMPPGKLVTAVTVYPYLENNPDIPTSWAGNVWMVPTL